VALCFPIMWLSSTLSASRKRANSCIRLEAGKEIGWGDFGSEAVKPTIGVVQELFWQTGSNETKMINVLSKRSGDAGRDQCSDGQASARRGWLQG
jgi:hypothetical protein